MECVLRATVMGRGIGERLNDLQLLDDRARPAMGDDERQRVVMLRLHMNEMNVQPVDLGDELGQGVESRLHLPPVVLRCPITRECLHRRQLHPLRLIGDGLPFRPAHRHDALAQVVEVRLRSLEAEGTDGGWGGVVRSVAFGHGRGHAGLLVYGGEQCQSVEVSQELWGTAFPFPAVAIDQPKVKQKSSTPGSRTSISKTRSLIGAGWRMSW